MSQTNVRLPEILLSVNGVQIAEAYEVEIHSNGYLAADRFSFRCASTTAGAVIWASVPLQVEISAGISGIWQSLLQGVVDRLELDPIRGDIRAAGRDLTAMFVMTQTHESFANLTSSDVATQLAARHGLGCSAVPTSTLIGRYYQDGHLRTALSQHGRVTTEWDLLSWLAQQESYDIWVQGTTLFFQPAGGITSTLVVSPNDCTELGLYRDMNIATGFTVEVQSWSSAMQETISGSATYGPTPGGASNIIASRANLSALDAQLLAQSTAMQLSRHERIIKYAMPADLTTSPRTQVSLIGTNTDFDGIYTVYEVERRFSVRHGFTQYVQARRPTWTTF